MSTIVQVPPGSGNTQQVPAPGDQGWGAYTTALLIALAATGFPSAGGNLFLTGDVNFGTMYGFILEYIKSQAAAPATSGVLRLGVADTIDWRNNANNGNLALGVNGSNQLTFNGSLVTPYTSITGSGAGISVVTTGTSVVISNTGVTSFGLSDASTTAIYTGSPASGGTGAVAATITLKTQADNTFLAGPISGAVAQPTFRTINYLDISGLFAAGNNINFTSSPAPITINVVPSGTVGGNSGSPSYEQTTPGSVQYAKVNNSGANVLAGSARLIFVDNSPTPYTGTGEAQLSIGLASTSLQSSAAILSPNNLTINGSAESATSFGSAAATGVSITSGPPDGTGDEIGVFINPIPGSLYSNYNYTYQGYMRLAGGRNGGAIGGPAITLYGIAGTSTGAGGMDLHTYAAGSHLKLSGGDDGIHTPGIVDITQGAIGITGNTTVTSGTISFEVGSTGIAFNGSVGTAGQILSSQGSGSNPIWSSTTASSIITLPTSFNTYTMATENFPHYVYLFQAPANPTTNLIIKLPAAAFDGQKITIKMISVTAVTAITWETSTGSIPAAFDTLPTSMTPPQYFTLVWNAAGGVWYQIG